MSLAEWFPWPSKPAPEVVHIDDPATYNIPPEHAALWEGIRNFPVDKPGVADPLSKRVARQQNWTPRYALRVVAEYKKFVFLCMTAGHMCTPSINVDMVWHEHLLYTPSYWDELCGKVLGKPLHHYPSEGGDAEEAKYAGLYQRTLDSYAKVFGEPPADIWGFRKRRTP